MDRFSRIVAPLGRIGRPLCKPVRGLFHIVCSAVFLLAAIQVSAQSTSSSNTAVQLVVDGGYPQLLVNGSPFFVHAAWFDYPRIPRDLWNESLDRYQALGINTLDLRIPWNWHEVNDGDFDFDGHSNGRRDLRGLLDLAASKGFHLIVHLRLAGNSLAAGTEPEATQSNPLWPKGGVPDWLEKQKDNASAEKRWLGAVAHELAPYQSTFPQGRSGSNSAATNQYGSAMLFVIVESADGQGNSPANRIGDSRAALEAGGMHGSIVLTSLDPSQNTPVSAGVAPIDSGSRALTGFSGRWISTFPSTIDDAPPGGAPLAPANVASLSLLGGILSMQPELPPLVSQLTTSGPAPADDVRAVASDPENLLLASRLLLGQGVRGFEYTPLQDSLTPAGWQTPGTNRYVRWDAPLDVAGNQQPAARGVERNAAMLRAWGTQLADAHLHADFGLVDPRMTEALASKDWKDETHTLEQIERVAQLAGLTPELLDLQHDPRTALLRDSAVLLRVPDGGAASARLSDEAQQALVEFVRAGGTLIAFPQKPSGKQLASLWRGVPIGGSAAADSAAKVWKFGSGNAIVFANDFYSWADPSKSFAENRSEPEATAAMTSFAQLVRQAASHLSTEAGERKGTDSDTAPDAPDRSALVVTQLVANDPGAVLTGRSPACGEQQLCAAALISATNTSWDGPAKQTLKVALPTLGAGIAPSNSEQLEVNIPPHESLLLPFHAPLCMAMPVDEPCPEEVIAAGAELLRVEHEGKVLELTFYTPARATIVLRLRNAPAKSEADDLNVAQMWDSNTHRLELSLPRGASPGFLRVLKVYLRDIPNVPEKPDPTKRKGRYIYAVTNTVGLSLGNDVSPLPSYPPLVPVNRDREENSTMTIDATRLGPAGDALRADVRGPYAGNATARMFGDENRVVRIRLASDANAGSASDSESAADPLSRGELRVRAGEQRSMVPLVFLRAGFPAINGKEKEGDRRTARYRFDFDRDGSDEWVLESTWQRLVLSPGDAGRALAWVDKTLGLDTFTTVGAMRDFLSTHDADGQLRLTEVGFNRSYKAEWAGDQDSPAIRQSYRIEDGAGNALIEKTARISGEDTMEVGYRFSENVAQAALSRSLVVMSSVPAVTGDERGTRFCWEEPAPQVSITHCEAFRPRGTAIAVPDGVKRLEVRGAGGEGLALEWTGGTMSIVPENYSAQLRWMLPAATPAASAEASLRYTILRAK